MKSDNVEKPGFVENNDLLFIGKGIKCQVFEIVKMKLVCKIYDTDNDAEYCYTLQRIAYRAGIGPEPMGLEKNYYFSRYIESYDKMDSVTDMPLWGISGIHKTGFRKVKESIEYQELMDKMLDIFGGDWADGHSGNIGVIMQNGRKQYVVIDFGIAGFINTDLGEKLAEKLQLCY